MNITCYIFVSKQGIGRDLESAWAISKTWCWQKVLVFVTVNLKYNTIFNWQCKCQNMAKTVFLIWDRCQGHERHENKSISDKKIYTKM